MLIDLPEEDYRRHNLEGKGKLPLCVRVEVLASVSHPVGNKETKANHLLGPASQEAAGMRRADFGKV